ncbi:KxYKxGKxW signal peptide domain-containing protein [Bacteroides sp. 214]
MHFSSVSLQLFVLHKAKKIWIFAMLSQASSG